MDGVIAPGVPSETGFLIDIIEVSISPATSDPTGPVDQGYLRIRGVLKELRLTKRNTPRFHSWWMMANGIRIQKQTKEGTIKAPLVYLDVDDIDLTGLKYCMPARAPDKYNKFLTGLIFEMTGYATGQFRRIGLFINLAEELNPLILARHENESKLPCENFDALTQTHTICIV